MTTTFNCKLHPECAGVVEFEGDVKITGNLGGAQLSVRAHPDGTTIGVKIGTFRSAEEHHEGLFTLAPKIKTEIQNSDGLKLRFVHGKVQAVTDTYYLTCSKGHTLPYKITIE